MSYITREDRYEKARVRCPLFVFSWNRDKFGCHTELKKGEKPRAGGGGGEGPAAWLSRWKIR